MNADAIAKAIPGVDEFVPIEGEDYAWHAHLKVALAAVQDDYGGTIRIENIDAPSQFRLIIIGESQQSMIDSSVSITLQEEEDQTFLIWDAEAAVSGKLASVGQRVIKAAATVMSSRFFQSIEDQLSEAAPSG